MSDYVEMKVARETAEQMQVRTLKALERHHRHRFLQSIADSIRAAGDRE